MPWQRLGQLRSYGMCGISVMDKTKINEQNKLMATGSLYVLAEIEAI